MFQDYTKTYDKTELVDIYRRTTLEGNDIVHKNFCKYGGFLLKKKHVRETLTSDSDETMKIVRVSQNRT